jgi:hypothetical protein
VNRIEVQVGIIKPRIEIPIIPAEGFSYKGASDRRFDDDCWLWRSNAKTDLAKLPLVGGRVGVAAGG